MEAYAIVKINRPDPLVPSMYATEQEMNHAYDTLKCNGIESPTIDQCAMQIARTNVEHGNFKIVKVYFE